jgi:A/G-specific adenine glycosylase
MGNARDKNELDCRAMREPEYKVLWSSKDFRECVKTAPGLQGFFGRFARTNLRDFPWRAKRVSAFHLLLVEVLLVQTKAEDVVAVWRKLVCRYPTPRALSNAKGSHLRGILRPLGLQNQRAASLLSIGKVLSLNFRGHVPQSVEGLLSIPHIGLYTAAAVSCFGFGQRLPIVDANVLRVLGRIHGARFGSDLRRSPQAWAVAWAILPKANPKRHNYGLLDFAAKVCTAKRPHCETCPLNKLCCFGREYLAEPDRSKQR